MSEAYCHRDGTHSRAIRRVHKLLHNSTVNATSDPEPSTPSSSSSSSSSRLDLIPWSFLKPWFDSSPVIRSHIRWLRSKELLNQDMFLLSSAGGPLRRWIALHYCAIYKREVEYLYLTRDTSESDLKQRREITATGTSVYVSQCVVEAAIHGRVLILEGIENAERNVLVRTKRKDENQKNRDFQLDKDLKWSEPESIVRLLLISISFFPTL